MAVYIRTSRTRALTGKPPTGSFSLNKDSPQARDLISWMPLDGNFAQRALPPTTEGFGQLVNPDLGSFQASDRGMALVGDASRTEAGMRCALTTPIVPSNHTISGWVRYIRSSVRDDGVYITGLLSSAVNRPLAVSRDNLSPLTFDLKYGGNPRTVFLPIDDVMSTDEWFFVCGSLDTSGTHTATIGVGYKGNWYTDFVAQNASVISAVDVGAGTDTNDGLVGYVRDIRVYERAMDGEEMRTLLYDSDHYDLWWQPARSYFFSGDAPPPEDQLAPAALQIGSDITDPGIVIEPELTIGPLGLELGSQLDDAELVVEAEDELTIAALAGGTQLDESTLVVEQPDTLIIADIEIGTELSDVTIVVEPELVLDIAPIQIGSQLEDATGELGDLITPDGLTLGTQLSDAVIPVTDLFPQALEVGTQLDTAVLFVEGITVDGELLEVVADDKTVIVSANRRRRTIL